MKKQTRCNLIIDYFNVLRSVTLPQEDIIIWWLFIKAYYDTSESALFKEEHVCFPKSKYMLTIKANKYYDALIRTEKKYKKKDSPHHLLIIQNQQLR
jgi:hypothetical protein